MPCWRRGSAAIPPPGFQKSAMVSGIGPSTPMDHTCSNEGTETLRSLLGKGGPMLLVSQEQVISLFWREQVDNGLRGLTQGTEVCRNGNSSNFGQSKTTSLNGQRKK